MEKALFWTLVRSLWVGLAAAALAGLVILATKRSSSSARYYGLCAILFGFFGVMVYILGMEWHLAVTPKHIAIVHELQDTFSNGKSATLSLYCRIIASLDETSGWACLLWMLCFAFKTIRLSQELFYIRRLRRQRILSPGAEWEVKVWVFRQQLGIRKAVAIFESALVKIPVTLGYLKPVILLPLGLIAQLPPEQVDAILWHELAHIRRRDYLVNIFQSVLEALFFFNPAVLWISTLIREERESCCDDIVLDQVHHRRSYLEALLAFQYSGPAGLSLGIGGRTPQLVRRLKRMVYRENRTLSRVERVLLLAGILLFSAFTVLHSGATKAQKEAQKAILINVPPRDTVPMAQLHSDTVLTNEFHRDSMRLRKDLPLPPLPPPPLPQQPNPSPHPADRMGDMDVDRNGARGPLDMKTGGDILEKAITDEAGARRKGNTVSVSDEFNAKGDSITDEFSMKKDDGNVIKMKMDTKGNPTDAKHNPDGIDGDRARVRLIIARLIGEKVIPDFKSLVWFGLDLNQLIVNGVKQPEILHQQLVNDFGIKEGSGLYYGSVQVTGRGVFLNKDDLVQ